MRLTKTIIDQACYQGNGKSRCVIWDENVSGFGLRVYPSGKKTFVLFYRKGHRQRLMTLGAYGVLTLKNARDLAKKTLAEVIDGEDPLAERQTAQKSTLVSELAERYIVEHAEVKKKPTSVQGDRQMLRDYVIPSLGHHAVVDVVRQDIAALHHSLHEKPYVANRVLALVSKMLTLAEKWGIRPDGSNPCRHIEKYKEHQRQRYLSNEELARLTTVLDTAEAELTESLHSLAAIRLLLLTGCRMREILRLRWEHIDFEKSQLHLPDSKTGAKTVFLAQGAVDILIALPRTRGNPWVIEGRKAESHLTHLKGPWRRLCKTAELKDVRIHDLRHTFAATAAGLGLSLPMIGKLLGHTQPRTTARYAHLAADPMHEAVNVVSKRLRELGGSSTGQT